MSKLLSKLLRAGLPFNDESITLIRKQEDIDFKKVKIAQLKHSISETDYQIIKCAEYLSMGKELPYDVNLLHKERQAMRDEINLLEVELEAENG